MGLLAAVPSGGSLAQWFADAIVVFIAWRLSRGGGGTAVDELSKANEVLTRRVHELGAEVRDLRIAKSELEQRTDFQAVLNEHERRATQRSEAQLRVLDLIAGRLGPEPPNGGGE